jgi:hypothetical protein
MGTEQDMRSSTQKDALQSGVSTAYMSQAFQHGPEMQLSYCNVQLELRADGTVIELVSHFLEQPINFNGMACVGLQPLQQAGQLAGAAHNMWHLMVCSPAAAAAAACACPVCLQPSGHYKKGQAVPVHLKDGDLLAGGVA